MKSVFRQFRRRRILIALAVAGVLGVAGGTWWYWLPQPDEVRSFDLRLADGASTKVTVDCFFPSDAESGRPAPTVVILHGVEGTTYARRSHLENARQIADTGFTVLLVHYFDPFSYADLVYISNGKLDVAQVEEHIYGARRHERQVWLEAVTESVRWAASQPEVDEENLFLLGYSLGGFLAISCAEECTRCSDLTPPRAVVVNFAARFRDAQLSNGLPPLQFHHGQNDDIVKVDYMLQTAAEVKQLGGSVDKYVYPDQGHVLEGEAAELCRERTYTFLRRLLRSARTADRT